MLVIALILTMMVGILVLFHRLSGWDKVEFSSCPPRYACLPPVSATSVPYSGPTVPATLNVTCDLIMRDFVYRWWSGFTSDESFPNHVRGLIASSINLFIDDAAAINWPQLLRQYVYIIKDRLLDTAAHEPASLNNSYIHDQCRSIIRRFLSHFIPKSETSVHLMLEELFTTTVALPLLHQLEPTLINQSIIDWVRADPQSVASALVDQVVSQSPTTMETKSAGCPTSRSTSLSHPDRSSTGATAWRLEISQAVLKFDPKPFVVYSIEIQYGHSHWEIGRRYSDFVSLHSQLLKCIPDFPVCLPKKTILDRFKRRFIELRRLELRRYLQQVINFPACLQTSVWFEWLTPRGSDMTATASPRSAPPSEDIDNRDSCNSFADSESEFIAMTTRRFGDYDDNPHIKLLVGDLLALFKSIIELDGNDVSLRTRTGFRIVCASVERPIRIYLRHIADEESRRGLIGRSLVWLTALVWPQGTLVEDTEPTADLSHAAQAALRRDAEIALCSCVPAALSMTLGQSVCRLAIRNILNLLNRKDELVDVVLLMLETTVQVMVSPQKSAGEPDKAHATG